MTEEGEHALVSFFILLGVGVCGPYIMLFLRDCISQACEQGSDSLAAFFSSSSASEEGQCESAEVLILEDKYDERLQEKVGEPLLTQVNPGWIAR